jgi:hypothetical protein
MCFQCVERPLYQVADSGVWTGAGQRVGIDGIGQALLPVDIVPEVGQ